MSGHDWIRERRLSGGPRERVLWHCARCGIITDTDVNGMPDSDGLFMYVASPVDYSARYLSCDELVVARVTGE